MHPEVRQEGPGKCPKCGMNLVLIEDKGLGKITWKSYIPLMVIFGILIVSTRIISSTLSDFIFYFMAGFFLVFAGFKLMDLKGFAEGYSTYDLLASRAYVYGYTYPFIELAFGFLMLAGYHSTWLLGIEFVVMAFSGIGVAIKLAKKEEFRCVCLGTVLKVPLTTVTFVEDFGMAILAGVFLFL